VALALWALGFVPLFIWDGRRSWRYWVATRKSLDKDTVTSPIELLTTLPEENVEAYLKRQADPAMESLRRKVWLALALWCLYGVLGHGFWAIVVDWLKL
jgi:hypothetical protein